MFFSDIRNPNPGKNFIAGCMMCKSRPYHRAKNIRTITREENEKKNKLSIIKLKGIYYYHHKKKAKTNGS